MKSVLKIILFLAAGILIGFFGGLLILSLFTGKTYGDAVAAVMSVGVSEYVVAVGVSILSFVLSVLILIISHEGGHLVCGLLSGYKFVSFRIFNLTFIRRGGKICVKRFAVAGTGGQCLLCPPDLPVAEIPVTLYNAGGVLANLLLLFIVAPLLMFDLSASARVFVVLFIFTDVIGILINGIPMKFGGIANDAYNMIYLRKNAVSKRALVAQLRSNALIQDGVRPKDMPDEWFEWKIDIDYTNQLEVSIPLMHASRLVDEMEWNRAYEEFSELYGHKQEIIKLYVNEIACELAFCAMLVGRVEYAAQLLDEQLIKYVETYSRVMSSKQRLLCAKAIYIDKNPTKAVEIYEKMSADQDKYLLSGEVSSDLAIMRHLIGMSVAK